MKKFWLAGWMLLQLAACASPARQTESLLLAPPKDLPGAMHIAGVPFFDQAHGHCGPAALAMVMSHAGAQTSAGELAPEVFTPGKGGSLQLDLVSATRRRGMMAVEVGGMTDLVREVAGGNPVLVFENLGLSWAPQWHYAVVTGFDMNKQELILHSGKKASKRESMRHFERAWSLAGFWGLTVLRAGSLSVTGDEVAHLKAAAGIELAGQIPQAEAAYKSILRRWPDSLGALVGLGNLSFQKGEFKRAAQFLRRAAESHPSSVVARHNLAVAEEASAQNK